MCPSKTLIETRRQEAYKLEYNHSDNINKATFVLSITRGCLYMFEYFAHVFILFFSIVNYLLGKGRVTVH